MRAFVRARDCAVVVVTLYVAVAVLLRIGRNSGDLSQLRSHVIELVRSCSSCARANYVCVHPLCFIRLHASM